MLPPLATEGRATAAPAAAPAISPGRAGTPNIPGASSATSPDPPGGYVDTRASDLSWTLDTEPLPALASLPMELPAGLLLDAGLGRMELRVLGASHQALVSPLNRDLGREGATAQPASLMETVACLPDRPASLPGAAVERSAMWRYSFTAVTRRYPARRFARRIERLLREIRSRPDAIAVTFPGDPHALTAAFVSCTGARLHWCTWHTYPQDGDIVTTRSEVTAR